LLMFLALADLFICRCRTKFEQWVHSVSDTLQSGPHFPTFRYATCIVCRKLYYVMNVHFTKVSMFYLKIF